MNMQKQWLLAEIKKENSCLTRKSSITITDDLCDEVATLKAEIEVVQAKLHTYLVDSRREAKQTMSTNMFWLLVG